MQAAIPCPLRSPDPPGARAENPPPPSPLSSPSRASPGGEAEAATPGPPLTRPVVGDLVQFVDPLLIDAGDGARRAAGRVLADGQPVALVLAQSLGRDAGAQRPAIGLVQLAVSGRQVRV